VQSLAAWLAANYIRLVRITTIWSREGFDQPGAHWQAGTPFILAFWHGRLLQMPVAWKSRAPMNMLISRHPDGELIARTIAHFGLGAVRGSPSDGGTEAARALVRAARAGECLGFTPDGPRGPRMRASMGVIDIARLTGLPVIPATWSTRRRRILGTWDSFCLPWPVGRGVIIWGTPIAVPRDADETTREAKRRELEDALNALTARADAACGHAPLAPADPAPQSREAAASA